MRSTRLFAFITTGMLLLTACSQEAEDTTVAVSENTNPLLAYAPADTPYVFAALEPIPADITDAYIARAQPMLDAMAEKVRGMNTAEATEGDHDEQMGVLANAVLNEMGGNFDADGLEKIGISVQSQHVMYGMGMFPVIRLGLRDAAAFRGAIDRIGAKMGADLPTAELDGTEYWRITDDEMSVGLYIAILDQHLAVGFFPANAEQALLPAFLGQDMPEHSMATSNALAVLNAEKGYTAYGSGILDIEKITAEFVNRDSTTYGYLDERHASEIPVFDEVCISEINTLVANMPRLTMGTTGLTANEVSVRYELEMDSLLAAALPDLVSDIPVAADGDQLMTASVALKVGKLRSFLLDKVSAVVASPYQCEHLQELNRNAGKMAEQLNIPMPPMVNNLLGLRVSVDDIDPTAEIPVESGLVALHVEKPEMFVGMASMMVPGFEELDLANQEGPVRIPADMFPMQGMEVYAMMGDSGIGLAVGEDHATQLGAFMGAKGSNDGTFLSVSYDSARQAALQSALMPDSHHGAPQTGDAELDAALQQTYESLLGSTRVEMRFTGTGLVMDNRMTFK